MKISKNFTLEELIASPTANRLNIDNSPSEEEKNNLIKLVNNVLQPLRDGLNKPIIISSGFRCKELNSRIGGSNKSDHVHGKASDIKGEDNAEIFNYIKDNLDFDQLIWEYGDDNQPQWVHVGFRSESENRNQILRATKSGYEFF